MTCILFFEILVIIPFYLALGMIFGIYPSTQALAVSLIITVLMSFFGTAFSYSISAISRNTVISILVPLIYLYTGFQLLMAFGLDWFVYEHHYQNFANYLLKIVSDGTAQLTTEQAASFLWIIAVPTLLLGVALIHFMMTDLRI